MKTKKYVGLALLFISLTLAITLGINFMLYAKDDHLFSEGITISGIDVGSLTKEQAQEKINQTLENWLAQPLEFQAGGEVITLPLAALNPQVDLETRSMKPIRLAARPPFSPEPKKQPLPRMPVLSWD